jgi:hypothetical protein
MNCLWIHLRCVTWVATFLGALFACAGSTQARDIGGTISSTLTIIEDSQLVDDVTCTVTDAPCIAIGASGITLDLNGFSMTGLADPETACSGGFEAGFVEDGIDLNGRAGVTIRGPGLVQRFRGPGIYSYGNGSGLTVTGVTVSTNCASGILVGGGSGHEISGNTAVRNGNGSNPCGGI